MARFHVWRKPTKVDEDIDQTENFCNKRAGKLKLSGKFSPTDYLKCTKNGTNRFSGSKVIQDL
jgi:hypothetical protein